MISTAEASRKLGTSPTTVNKLVSRLKIEKTKMGKFAYITRKDFEKLSKSYSKPKVNSNLKNNSKLDLNLEKQLSEKDRQIEMMQKSLDQEQQLHASSVQRVQRLEERIKLIEHQPNEQLTDMIALLEKTRDSFLSNQTIINRLK